MTAFLCAVVWFFSAEEARQSAGEEGRWKLRNDNQGQGFSRGTVLLLAGDTGTIQLFLGLHTLDLCVLGSPGLAHCFVEWR